MSSTSTPVTFSDLYTDLLNRMRLQTSETATATQAKRYINIALQDMHVGFLERFPWAERKARITTRAPYSTGTVSISKGSVTLTGTSTVWTTADAFGIANARAGGKIVIAGGPEVYDVSAVGGAGTITLGQAFVSTTVADGTYVYYEDEYDLDADFARPLDMQFFDSDCSIAIVDRTAFRRQYPKNAVTGKPLVACIMDRTFSASTTPVRRAAFWRPPDKAYSIPYNFVTNKLAVTSAGVAAQFMSSDADEPIVPVQYRHLILFHGIYHWYRDKKDDARSQEAKREYTDLLLRVTGDTEVGERRPRISPAMTGYRGRAKTPYRSGTRGHWTTGSRFDEMR